MTVVTVFTGRSIMATMSHSIAFPSRRNVTVRLPGAVSWPPAQTNRLQCSCSPPATGVTVIASTRRP